jgi:hypothetical protein
MPTRQESLDDFLVSEGNDPRHVAEAVRAYVVGFCIATADEPRPFKR